MGKWNDIEVHSENTTYNRGWGQQAGYDRHHLHYFVQPEVYVADIKIMHTHHDIAVVFAEVKRLYNMVVHVFKILGGPVDQQFTFTPDDAIDEIPDRRDISL